MLYSSAQEWRDAPHKSVLLFAMSGLGKTYVSEALAETGNWFHYSIDYRIGTRYMVEHIADNLKAEAMKSPFLAEMLRADLIHISPNIHDHDLRAVAAYLGKPGNSDQGGLEIAEYTRRQSQFRSAEIAALKDTAHFSERAKSLYGYPHFICDTGGSICEWIDPDDRNDPLMTQLSDACLMVWIEGTEAHNAELVRRFDKAPKPMAYQPEFLARVWGEYLEQHDGHEARVDPDAFLRWTYAKALAHRQPRYAAMARNFGVVVPASDMSKVSTAQDFEDVIADAIERRMRGV